MFGTIVALTLAAAPVPAAEQPARSATNGDDRTAVRKVVKLSFKPGKGFELATEDGRYTLAIRARLQVRYDFEHPNMLGLDNIHSLQIRRARLQLTGNVFGKHNRYYIQLGFSPRDMTGGLVSEEGSIRRNPLRDARLEFTYLRDLSVWVGQMKVPFSRQRVNSSGNQQFVDRSAANEEYNLDRDIGLQVRSEDLGGVNRMRYMLGVFFGQGRNAFELANKGFLYVGRFEVHPLGAFESESEGDLERMRKPGLSIGAAYAYHDDAPGERSVHGSVPVDGGTTDIHHTTADLVFKYRGFSLSSALHLRKARKRNPGGALDEDGAAIDVASPRDGLGFLAQAGYLVPRIDLEVVGRYSGARNVFGARSALLDRDEAGGGLNYYFVGHNLKLQLDYFRVWEAAPGISAAQAARDGTDRLRLQIQLAF
jgi:phosphate-selective porin OprO and OprP